ncbi:uncharacterized protein, partial [Salvelinus sp. IW2-2015]|uniref:uncharacterized protein n=1 Tax=Salvelinus sp. IW2-2015 TaxID=2691554 RepID=UPI0038D35FF9
MSATEDIAKDYYDYPDWNMENAVPTKVPVEVIPPCDPTADDRLYHICISAISLVVMLILAFLARRRKLADGQKRVPGLLSPVNFLDHTQHKGLAVAVFGVLFCKLFGLVIAPNPLPFTTDQANKQYWIIVSLFYYPVLYFPLLACGTLRNAVGYVLGSLLSWTHFGVLVWQKADCPKTPEQLVLDFLTGRPSGKGSNNISTPLNPQHVGPHKGAFLSPSPVLPVHATTCVAIARPPTQFIKDGLKKFGFVTKTLTNFYRCTIESILSGCYHRLVRQLLRPTTVKALQRICSCFLSSSISAAGSRPEGTEEKTTDGEAEGAETKSGPEQRYYNDYVKNILRRRRLPNQ